MCCHRQYCRKILSEALTDLGRSMKLHFLRYKKLAQTFEFKFFSIWMKKRVVCSHSSSSTLYQSLALPILFFSNKKIDVFMILVCFQQGKEDSEVARLLQDIESYLNNKMLYLWLDTAIKFSSNAEKINISGVFLR